MKDRGGFLDYHSEVAGARMTFYSSFESNTLLNQVYSKSLFIVAILRYILNYTDVLLHSTDTPAEDDANGETATQLIDICHTFVSELDSRHTSFSSFKDVLPDESLQYQPGVCNDEFLFGVPHAIACSTNDTEIFAWLQHFWFAQRETVDPVVNIYDDDDDDDHMDLEVAAEKHGYRRLLDNLWHALSLSAEIDFEDFFETWDAEHLVPILKHTAQRMAPTPMTGDLNGPPLPKEGGH
jgi:hypothetical protein